VKDENTVLRKLCLVVEGESSALIGISKELDDLQAASCKSAASPT